MAQTNFLLRWAPYVLAALGVLGGIYAQFIHSDQEFATRISVLEAKETVGSDRLNRMESKLDRLVEWALGK